MAETVSIDHPPVAKPVSRPRSRRAATVSASVLAQHLDCSRTYIGKLEANLANLDGAMRGGLLDLINVKLLAVGGGPTLDFVDAAEFLAGFETVIEKVRRRRMQ